MNPLAKEEYEEEKERLEELATQRQDLEASLAEIEKLRDELAETVAAALRRDVRRGRAQLRGGRGDALPGRRGPAAPRRADEDDEGDELEAGIEVELRPAGKRITRLSLLSGGEKALGAISFLFALFLAKPCPFYLLDEVEAALDDANIDALRRAAAPLRRPRAVHRDHAPEADDGGGRRALRRHDGRRRRLAGRLAPAAAARPGRRRVRVAAVAVESARRS